MARFLWEYALLGAVATLMMGCGSVSGAAHYTRGSDALEAGDSGAAVAHLERAAELVPHGSEIQNHLGIAYQAEGRRDDALAAYERAVALDCDNAAARHNRDALRAHLFPDSLDPAPHTVTDYE